MTVRDRDGSRRGADVRRGAAVLGIAVGASALALVRHNPSASFGGASIADGIVELVAGWSLLGVGLAFWARRPRNHFGPLLATAGVVWFLPEWSNPAAGSPFVFTVGLVGIAACAPVVVHSPLVYPRGRARSTFERGALAVGYAGGFGLLGLLPTAVFDPAAEGCLQCPTNVLLVHSDHAALDALFRWGLRVELAWALALVALIAWRLVRGLATRSFVAAPVLAPTAAFLGFVAADLGHSVRRNALGNDAFDLRLWRFEAVALVMMAGGAGWGIYNAHRARAAVARLAVDLGSSSSPGGARDALARALGDPDLQLSFRPAGTDRYVDARGRHVDVDAGGDRVVTPLLRQGRPVAVLVHDAAVLRDPDRVEDVVAAARLAVEHECFQADLRAQFERLRASRVRIVEAGDLERRGLERDLHDGAQQRLVGLAIALRLLRAHSAGASPELEARLDAADAELRVALAELREVAHGMFPAILADEGLAAAIETLVERSPGAIGVRSLPTRRLDGAVEAAAYFVIAETLRRSRATRASVALGHRDGRLSVEVEADGDVDEPLIDLEDRVGALDGLLTVERVDGTLRVHAELPCA